MFQLSRENLKPRKSLFFGVCEFKYVMKKFLILSILIFYLFCLSGCNSEENKGGVYIESTASYSAQKETADQLFECRFILFGKTYKLPCAVSEFIDSGWSFTKVPPNLTGRQNSTDAYEMVKNDGEKTYRCSVRLANAGADSCKADKGIVYLIKFEDINFANDIDFDMCGITAQSTKDAVSSKFGSDALSYTSDDVQILLDYSSSGKLSSISISNQNIEYEELRAGNNPDLMDSYVEPISIGKDIKNPIVRLGGNLYRLPAPVSAFIKNGWTVGQGGTNLLPAGGTSSYGCMLQRDGVNIAFTVYNPFNSAEEAQKCLITSVSTDDTDSLVLSADIEKGMKKERVQMYLSGFSHDEPTPADETETYIYNDKYINIELRFDMESERLIYMKESCTKWQ